MLDEGQNHAMTGEKVDLGSNGPQKVLTDSSDRSITYSHAVSMHIIVRQNVTDT